MTTKTKAKASPKKKAAKPLDAKEISSHVGKLSYEDRTALIAHLSKISEIEQSQKGNGQEPDLTGYDNYGE